MLFALAIGNAWPWDKNDTVEGYAFCTGPFDLDTPSNGNNGEYMRDGRFAPGGCDAGEHR